MTASQTWGDYAFTDRDVRDYPDLRQMAYEYLREYTGGFQFLRDMKNLLEQLDGMSIGMVRGVLNCMRSDPRAASKLIEVLKTPRPEFVIDDEISADVVSIHRRRESCKETYPHSPHKGCKGIPWKVNRQWRFDLPATIKKPFVLARTGKLVHRVAASRSVVIWEPISTHHEGFGQPTLYVRVLCPQRGFCNPFLWDEKELSTVEFLYGATMCRRCQQEWDDHQSAVESVSSSPSQPESESCGAPVEPAFRTVPKLVFMQPSAAPSER